MSVNFNRRSSSPCCVSFTLFTTKTNMIRFELEMFIIFVSVQYSGEYGQGASCVQSTCYVDDEWLNFAILGDWGGKSDKPYYSHTQIRVAESMNKVLQHYNNQFFVSTGDNFYMNGVTGENDFRFQNTYENIYDKPAHQKPWYIIAGNHDHNGNVSAQIAYTSRNNRWIYPNLYYKFSYGHRNKFTVDFLMIDTIILCGNIADNLYLAPPGPKDTEQAEKQWQWIENMLKSSTSTYLFIVGHYPVRSKGRNGQATSCMKPRMEALMKKYSVTAYICGHDHNLQHLQYTYNGDKVLTYVVSGMGSMNDDVQITLNDTNERSFFFHPETISKKDKFKEKEQRGGFVVGSFNQYIGSFTFYNGERQKLYYFKLFPRTK